MNDFVAGIFTTIGLLFVVCGYQVSKQPMCGILAALMIFFGLPLGAMGIFMLLAGS